MSSILVVDYDATWPSLRPSCSSIAARCRPSIRSNSAVIYQVGRKFSLFDRNQLRMLFLFPAMMVVFAVLFGLKIASRDPAAFFIFIPLSIGFAWTLHVALSIPHTIEWNENGTIDFCAYRGRRTFVPREIVSIEPKRGQVGFLVLRTSEQKKVLLINQFDDFDEFLARLKAENPSVKLRGC